MSSNNWGAPYAGAATANQPGASSLNSNQGWGNNSQSGQNPSWSNQPGNYYPGQMQSQAPYGQAMSMQQMQYAPVPQRRQGMSALVYGLLAMFVPIPVIDIIWAWRGIKIANETGDTPAKVVSIIGMIWSISFNLWFFGFVIFGMLVFGSALA